MRAHARVGTGEPRHRGCTAPPVRTVHRAAPPAVHNQAAREPGSRAADREQPGPLSLVIARERKSRV